MHFWGLRPRLAGEHGSPDPASRLEVSSVLRTSAFRFLAASFAIAAFASFAVVFNIVPLLTSRGLSTELAALALGLGGVGQVAGRLAYRRLATSTGVRGRAVVLLAGEGLSIAALAIVPGPAGALIALTLVVGAIRGMFTLLQATAITDRWGADHYGSLSGVLAVPVTTAMAVAPWAGAAVAGALGSYPASIGVFAALCLVAAGLAWFSR